MKEGDINFVVFDYLYCVYLLGILIHTVNINGIGEDVARKMFENKL
jgi:hypothetical protein